MDRRKTEERHFDWPALLMALTGGFIASGLIAILGFVTWALVFREIPQANANAFTLLIGILSTNVGMIVGFYFGASYANSRKDQVIDTMAKTANTVSNIASAAAPQSPDKITLPAGEEIKVAAADKKEGTP